MTRVGCISLPTLGGCLSFTTRPPSMSSVPADESGTATAAPAAPPTPLIFGPDHVTSCIAEAERLKAEGSALLQAGDAAKAAGKYSRVLAYVKGLGGLSDAPAAAQQSAIDALLFAGNSNLALCHLRLAQPERVLAFASAALQLQPQSVKCLFRRGAAFLSLGNVDAARADLEAASSLCPADAAIRAELVRLRSKERKQENDMRRQFAGCFSSSSSSSSSS